MCSSLKCYVLSLKTNHHEHKVFLIPVEISIIIFRVLDQDCKKLYRKLERITIKQISALYRANPSSNETCLNNKLLPPSTNMYIFIEGLLAELIMSFFQLLRKMHFTLSQQNLNFGIFQRKSICKMQSLRSCKMNQVISTFKSSIYCYVSAILIIIICIIIIIPSLIE